MNSVAVGIYSFYMRLNEMAINVLPGRLFDNIIQPMFFAMKPAEADGACRSISRFLVNMNLMVLWPILHSRVAYHARNRAGGIRRQIHRAVLAAADDLGFCNHQQLLDAGVSGGAVRREGAHPIAQQDIRGLQRARPVRADARMGLYGAALAIGSSQILKNSFIWWHMRRRAVWVNAARRRSVSVAPVGRGDGAVLWDQKRWCAPALVQLLLGVVGDWRCRR